MHACCFVCIAGRRYGFQACCDLYGIPSDSPPQASCNPVAYSLIADFYPENRRAFAFSVYHFGVYLGGAIGYLCGVINESLNWQWTYHILGIIGIVSVPIAFVTLWEPKSVRESRRRRRQEKSEVSIKVTVVVGVPLWVDPCGWAPVGGSLWADLCEWTSLGGSLWVDLYGWIPVGGPCE